MLINAVCGNGLGSSLILKINIDKILKEMGYEAEVETTDIASVKSSDADLIVTTEQFKNNLSDINKEVIYVKNVTDKNALKEKITDFISERG